MNLVKYFFSDYLDELEECRQDREAMGVPPFSIFRKSV